MKTYQACIPCVLTMMESTLEITDLDKQTRQDFLTRFQADWEQADMSLPPGRTAGALYHKILREIGQDDLFLAHKETSIQEALNLYPRLKKLADESADSLDVAIRISALGNILDIANPNSYDLEEEINHLLEYNIRGESLEIFREKIASAGSLLILADNAGETVFDKVLIETIDVPVIYAVKSGPAFDDALIEDTKLAGIDKVARTIETGHPYPGTYIPECSLEFQELFQKAPVILAKGQANFESLSDTSRDIFFLLKVKCEIVQQEIGCPVGSLVLKYHQSNQPD